MLRVTVSLAVGVDEEFLARMSRDGRITIPKLIVDLLRDEEETLVGYVLEVNLKPA